MLFLRFMLIATCFGLFACVAGMVLYDIYLADELDRLLLRRQKQPVDVALPGEIPAPTPPVASLRIRRQIRKKSSRYPGISSIAIPGRWRGGYTAPARSRPLSASPAAASCRRGSWRASSVSG